MDIVSWSCLKVSRVATPLRKDQESQSREFQNFFFFLPRRTREVFLAA